MSTETQSDQKAIPADYGKMPQGYDFTTKGKDWKEYSKDFILRTDAVWEKDEMKNWFRSYMKCFYFDQVGKKYQFFEPEDMYTVLFEGWALDDLKTFPGFTPTGRTNSFQAGIGPKQRVAVPAQTWYHMQDYYMLCGLRFERWFRCDIAHYDQRGVEFDYKRDQKNYTNYPCYREFYESQYACNGDLFDFMLELAYSRRANDIFEGDVAAYETQLFPSFYDSDKTDKKYTYTY